MYVYIYVCMAVTYVDYVQYTVLYVHACVLIRNMLIYRVNWKHRHTYIQCVCGRGRGASCILHVWQIFSNFGWSKISRNDRIVFTQLATYQAKPTFSLPHVRRGIPLLCPSTLGPVSMSLCTVCTFMILLPYVFCLPVGS